LTLDSLIVYTQNYRKLLDIFRNKPFEQLQQGEDATLSGSYNQSPHPQQQKSSGPLLAYTTRWCYHERLADLA
jgi:hypothetical protein